MKIIALGKLINSRIESISIIKKELDLLPKESKILLDKLLDNKFNDIYLEDKHKSTIDKLFDYIDFEYDYEEEYCMNLGSSKYGILAYQEKLKEATDWYDNLTDKEKEYVDLLREQYIPVAM